MSQAATKIDESKSDETGLWRDLTAYWILGLCNNYGYVVMLSAAHDIIGQFDNNVTERAEDSSKRQCQFISTGAILLADILPSLIVKPMMPFLPFWVNLRIALAVIFSAAGFLLVAFANAEWITLSGVALTSASCGMGEATFLAYSVYYNRNVVSTWSSGTGGAGIIGSLSYAVLRSFDISPRNTMLIMLAFPCFEASAFWLLLRQTASESKFYATDTETTDTLDSDEQPLVNFKAKLFYIRQLLRYMIPLIVAYFFEYFINQGLYELIYFEQTFLSKAAQYRWFNVDFQIGVFISRSSVNLVPVKQVWLIAVLQFINVIYFLSEVIYFYTPNIWFTFAIVFWEGILGGAAYVNTFYNISKEVAPVRLKFAMAVVVQSDVYGISAAGFLAIPVHNALCALPIYKRSFAS